MSDSELEDEVQYSVRFDGDPQVYNAIAKDGSATATFPNGDIYVGEYKDGKRNGKGTYSFGAGGKYEGFYLDNLRHGEGRLDNPDGSYYAGQWKRGKFSGQGLYFYPNGDTYEGSWNEGRKHGQGVYSYAKDKSSISGEWAWNRCLNGQWVRHDKSKYVGRFTNNTPAGEGMFVFANGVTQSGRFMDQSQWVKDPFKPAPGSQTVPKPEPPSATTKANRLMKRAQIVTDHYEGLQFVPASESAPPVEESPNFRQAGETPVFGIAQPSIEGLRQSIEAVTEHGFEKIIWLHLRADPVAYVGAQPFTCRTKKNVNKKLSLPDSIAPKDADELLAARLQTELGHTGGLLRYWKAAVADRQEDQKAIPLLLEVEPQEPEEDLDEEEEEHQMRPEYSVQTLEKVFATLAQEEDSEIDFQRLELLSSATPSPTAERIDSFLHAVAEIGPQTAVVCSNRSGADATSYGMLLAALVAKLAEPDQEPEEGDEGYEDEHDEEADEDEQDYPEAKAEAPSPEEQVQEIPPDYKLGEYAAIMKVSQFFGEEAGVKIKSDVDQAIDRCGVGGNLREAIWMYKTRFHEAKNDELKSMWKQRAFDLYTKYSWLIAAHGYLRAKQAGDIKLDAPSQPAEDPAVQSENVNGEDESHQEDEAEEHDEESPEITMSKWLQSSAQAPIKTILEGLSLDTFNWE